MSCLAETYQHIADILSFHNSNENLKKTLDRPNFNWDYIVIEGSKHLVLPAIYCRLKAKRLLHLLPKDLESYLEEIANINRNRNTSLLEQISNLSHLFNNNNIEYVFLKGSALLVLDCYEDIAERMIGDIDILVAGHQIQKAFELLKYLNYEPSEVSIRDKFFDHKHLPRLINKEYIGAVELHHKLFISNKEYSLNPSEILFQRQIGNNIPIPSKEHLLKHNILNYQINDKGNLFNSISFRSAYDTIKLLRIGPSIYDYSDKKNFKKYYAIVGAFLADIKEFIDVKPSLHTSFYLFKLKHVKFYRAWNKILMIRQLLKNILSRTVIFITNSEYRNAIIIDRNRIFKYFKSILINS